MYNFNTIAAIAWKRLKKYILQSQNIHILFIYSSYVIHILFIYYSYIIRILFIYYSYIILLAHDNSLPNIIIYIHIGSHWSVMCIYATNPTWDMLLQQNQLNLVWNASPRIKIRWHHERTYMNSKIHRRKREVCVTWRHIFWSESKIYRVWKTCCVMCWFSSIQRYNDGSIS